MSLARAYYEPLVGSWSGRFDLAITNGGPGGAGLRAMAMAARAVGGLWMATTLATDGDDFVHTTRVTKAGILVFATDERIRIHGDGTTLTMEGHQRAAVGRPEPYTSTGEVRDAKHTVYRVPWAGTEIEQRMAVQDDGALELVQETPWTLGRVLLRRA